MADATTQNDSGTATGSQTQQAPVTTQQPDVTPKPSTLPDDPAILKSEIEKLRAESAERRVKNKTIEAELNALREKQAEEEKARQLEQGKFKELYEKSERENAEKIAQLTNLRKKDALRAAAIEAGILDSDLVNLIPMDKIDPNSDTLNDARAVVTEFRNSKPHLFKAQTVPQPQNQQSPPTQFTPMPGAVGSPGAGDATPFDAMTATKAERDAHLMKIRKQLAKTVV